MSEPTMADFFEETARQHHEILQSKVRKVGAGAVVYIRWYDFIKKVPTTEWKDKVRLVPDWRYPDLGKLRSKLNSLAKLTENPRCTIILHFDTMYDACNVAKALVDYFQPFGTICDMYDDSMNVVFSLEKAAFVIYFGKKRYNLIDVKRGVIMQPDSPSTNSKEYFDQLLTILRNNAIFPTDNIVTHK